ncbi:hypothetical protein ISF6_1588 [Piscinibacter sakaiensis]|uniref:Uncharacterized protein n=1 Tax=Piscinibacter sakaiensis TaxID=1547922 RepID=A0A0K8P0W7_PISS1|nr:hypothetical protein ISF6_1588 [Piscinibacter sakaiensis]
MAQVRLDNALRLFDEFVSATVKHPDAATLRGLERRFAERLDIQPSYWSQIKSRSRQIGERLARQFEQRCHKPMGWMDRPHDAAAPSAAATAGAPGAAAGREPQAAATPEYLPRDDDERFILGLVLTYYRRHPQRARTRLLDLLGEVLTPPPASPPAPAPGPAAPSARRGTPAAPGALSPAPSDDPNALWDRMRAGIAPLKKKR